MCWLAKSTAKVGSPNADLVCSPCLWWRYTGLDVDISMKPRPLSEGQTVKIRPQVKDYGGKTGTVVYEGREFGWRVVKVRFDDLPRPVAFTPDEVARD